MFLSSAFDHDMQEVYLVHATERCLFESNVGLLD